MPLKIVFILANSTDLDEMPLYLGFLCLLKYLLLPVLSIRRVKEEGEQKM